MPTAGRLAGAISFALFGWYLAGLSVPLFPEGIAPAYWVPAVSFIGLIVGWRICGPRSGQGYYKAALNGLTCGVTMSFCAVFIMGFSDMITRSLRMQYTDGPMEAVADVFNLMVRFAGMFADQTLIISVLVGGIICAWVTEFFGRRYP